MKPINNIDQFFKEKLEHRDFVLEDAFVADMENKLDAQSKAGFSWGKFWLGFALVGGLLFAGVYSFYQKEDTTITTVAASENLPAKEAIVKTKRVGVDKKQEADTDEKVIKNNTGVVVANQPIKPLEENNATEKTQTVGNSRKENSLNKKEAKSDIVAAQKEVETLKTTPSTPTNTTKENDTSPVETSSDNSLSTTTKSVDNLASSTLLKTDESINSKEKPKETETAVENTKTSNKEPDDQQQKVEETENNSASAEETVEKTSEKKPDEPVKKPSEKVRTKKWAVSIFAGPSVVSKNITGNENEAHYATRKEGEENILAFNYGVGFDCFLTNNIAVATGLNQQTYGEDVAYTVVDEINTQTITVISSYDTTFTVIVDSMQGTTIDTTTTPVYTDETSSDTTYQELSSKNRYSYVQIPFMLGYQKQWNKLAINVKAGVVYGRLVRSSGSYINADGTAIEPANLKKNIFNVAVSTAISYPIKKVNLFIEPRYQFNISNVFPNADTDQKYKVWGVNFGVGLTF